MRQLVTLAAIRDLQPIPTADQLLLATVRNWRVVVRAGDFAVGDKVVFFEIDSALPLSDPRFVFLAPRGSVIYNGRAVHVLRTARLRGQISQGLVLPAGEFPELDGCDGDLAERLGVTLWEPNVGAHPSAGTLGPFPTREGLRKTDAERVQNLDAQTFERLKRCTWYPTEKIDGMSITLIGADDGHTRVCSRNWELHPESAKTQLATAARQNILPERGTAVQAELYGEGIQSNPLAITGRAYAVFGYHWLNPATGQFERVPYEMWPTRLKAHAAPILDVDFPDSCDEMLAQADGLKSAISPEKQAEGIVWHCDDILARDIEPIKAINNTLLLANDTRASRHSRKEKHGRGRPAA